jgi:hypothetical protein
MTLREYHARQEPRTDMYDADWNVTEAMIRYGGSFVQGLGNLYRRADDDNKARLKTAFPEYFRQYQRLAERAKATQCDDPTIW